MNKNSKVKAVATATAKKSINLDAINSKVNSKKQSDSKQSAVSKKSVSKKQSASKKQSVVSDSKSVKLSAYKTACRNVASLSDSASDDDKKLSRQLVDAIQHDDFNVVLKDTTACCLFIVDDNKNTVCNVYDCLRIQFTTVQARKYHDALLADSEKRFFTHVYKNNEFISCKCSDFDSFVSAMNFVYSVYTDSKKQSATATETASSQQEAK